MRDEKEERKKQARSNKQTRQSNTAHPRQSHVYTCISLSLLCQQAVSAESVSSNRAGPTPHVRFSSTTTSITAQPTPHSPPTTSTHPPLPTSHTLTKRTVYIKEEGAKFPPTKVGGQSTLKLKVCNKDSVQHQVYTCIYIYINNFIRMWYI